MTIFTSKEGGQFDFCVHLWAVDEDMHRLLTEQENQFFLLFNIYLQTCLHRKIERKYPMSHGCLKVDHKITKGHS